MFLTISVISTVISFDVLTFPSAFVDVAYIVNVPVPTGIHTNSFPSVVSFITYPVSTVPSIYSNPLGIYGSLFESVTFSICVVFAPLPTDSPFIKYSYSVPFFFYICYYIYSN